MLELSPSQLSTFELCPRKWAWSKIEGLRLPSNAQAQFGTDVHAHLEEYLSKGTPIDLTKKTGEVALAMLPYAPAPGEAAIEEWFYLDFWGHRLRGKKDAERFAVVWDWKTTSDLMWAKTPETLREDIAACVYALDSMLKSGLDYAHLRWVYAQRKKPFKVRPVDVTLTKDDIVPTLRRVKKIADEIANIPSGARALDLPYDANACSAYGGCPYVELCNLTPEEKMRSAMHQDLEVQKQAFFAHAEKLKQQSGGFGYAVNPPVQGRQPMNQQNFAPPGFNGNGNGGPPQGGFQLPPMQQPQQQFQQPPMQQQAPQQAQFQPPMQQQFQSSQMQQQPMTVNGNPAVQGWQPQQQQQAQFQAPAQQQAPAQFQAPGQEAPKGKGGRPKGAKNKATNNGEASHAAAYNLIAQGFAMLAHLSTEEESEG